MNEFAAYGSLSDIALLLGLASTRVAVALLLVPLFTADLIPALVRGALFMALGSLGLLAAPVPAPQAYSLMQWMSMFATEAFIGAAIGFLFGGMLWAFEAAGQIIDTKVGTTQGQLTDPLSGHQTTLTGALFARLGSWVFMAGGGFMVLVGVLIQSYALWPVRTPLPALTLAGTAVFESELGRIMLLALALSAPALVVLHLVEGVLGLINRFAQQLNVFSLSMSIKAVASIWVIWLQLGLMMQVLQDDLLGRGGVVIQALKGLLQP
jgi:type III secretion protein T